LRRGWVMSALTLELRKILSYRADFWLLFIGGLVAQFGVAWFLWASIFQQQQLERVGDFSFPALMLYYLAAPLMLRIVQGYEMGSVSGEIYEGALNRYLIYAGSYFRFKLTTSAAHSLVFVTQFILIMLTCILFFGLPEPFHISTTSVLQCICVALCAAYLHFVMAAAIELTAFWADNVWSLVVMMRFATGLLGGAMIPLSLFPEWAQGTMFLLPFAYFVAFPLRCLLGLETSASWMNGMTVVLFWSVIMTMVYAYVWGRGRYRYTGVGI
jgi:ABC-2 type transport system permease protein